MRASPYSNWSNPRSPGSRAKSVRTCQCLRPRRVVRALAIARPNVLLSALSTASAPRGKIFSRLNGWPMRSPADASPTSSRAPAHGSGPMRFAIPSSQWTCTTYSLPVSRRTDSYREKSVGRGASCAACARSNTRPQHRGRNPRHPRIGRSPAKAASPVVSHQRVCGITASII